MITTPTVLILGAGASKPFGFPTGRELLQEVVENLVEEPKKFPRTQLLRLGYSAEEIRSFRIFLSKSGQPSVDAFLEHRPEFVRLGKTAIAQALIPCESLETLFDKTRDSVNWYQHLSDLMDTSLHGFRKNEVSVLTFNYDRSLEAYFFSALQNSHRLSDAECAELLGELEIVHLYGQLGFLPWQGEKGRPYEPDIRDESVVTAAEGIKILSERDDNASEFKRAHELILEARRIVFLGFGYHQTNLQRLKMPELLSRMARNDPSPAWGTAFGLGRAQRDYIRRSVFSKAITLGNEIEDVLRFLKQKIHLAD